MSSRGVSAFGSIALGVGIAASAVLGPLGLRVIELRTSEHLKNQFIGGELVSLAVVAPAAIAAGVLWLRGRRVRPALALGPAMYAAYTYTTVVLGQEYGRYDGNAERFFPLYAGLVAGGAAIATIAWAELSSSDVRMPTDGLRRGLAGSFLAIGTMFALAWVQQIRLVIAGNPSVEYKEGPALFWVIKLLDFGIVIPLLVSTGVGLLRRRAVAVRAAYGLAPFATCLAASIMGMAVTMEINGDPSAQPAMMLVLPPVVMGLAGVTIRLLRSDDERPARGAADPVRAEAYYHGRRGLHA